MNHIPVLLNEVVEALKLRPGKFIVDGTVNGGGHADALIKRITPGGIFLGIDLDWQILKRTKRRIEFNLKIENWELKILFAHDNYSNLPKIIEQKGLPKADGLLLDLGFSSEQLTAKKGFGYHGESKLNEPLDMRYDTTGDEPTAAEVVNGLREEELADIFWKYGEERFARRIAHGIVEARKEKRVITVGELVEAIRKSVPQFFKKGESDVTMRIFQALRIYVNRELENVENILGKLEQIVNPGGRVAIITFHSLEDRLVKNKFKELETENKVKIINKKPIIPTDTEINQNPRSRSAKLRVLEIKN